MNSSPTTLAQLQDWMQSTLMYPLRTSHEQITTVLEGSPHLSADARLAIHQRSYHARLLKCMEEQFPALHHALGAALFRDFAGEYLRSCPSRSYTLYRLGERFPAWLEQHRPDHALPAAERESWIDFMVDLATFEHELFRLFDAPGDEDKTFATTDTPDDRLMLQRCQSLQTLRYPVAEYYTQVRHQLAPAFPPARPSSYALVRRDYQIRILPLTPPHRIFLTSLAEGTDIANALNTVAATLQRPPDQVVRAWAEPAGSRENWIAAGLFIERDGTH